MSSIDYSQSRALLLAADIEQHFKSQEQWVLDFERNIQVARKNYDAENDEYDSRERYPDKRYLEERFVYWTTALNSFASQQQQLVDLSGSLHQKFSQLNWVLLDATTIAKLKFIHTGAGEEIENYHSEIRSRMSVMSQNLSKIQDLAKKALTEINWIRNHPHRRLQQTLARVTDGQYASSYLSITNDRISRNVSSLGTAVWGSQATAANPVPSFSANLPPASQQTADDDIL